MRAGLLEYALFLDMVDHVLETGRSFPFLRRDLAGSTPPKHRLQRDLARFSAVGIELGIIIGLFVWIGKSLDQQWGTAPWLLLLGMFLGLFGGFYRLKLKFTAWNKAEKDKVD